jgi:hypothetical protein
MVSPQQAFYILYYSHSRLWYSKGPPKVEYTRTVLVLRGKDLEYGLVKFVQKLATFCKFLQAVVELTGRKEELLVFPFAS